MEQLAVFWPYIGMGVGASGMVAGVVLLIIGMAKRTREGGRP